MPLKVSISPIGTKRPAKTGTAAPEAVLVKLIVSAPKGVLDQVGAGKMTFEEAKRLNGQGVRVSFVVEGGLADDGKGGLLVEAEGEPGAWRVVWFVRSEDAGILRLYAVVGRDPSAALRLLDLRLLCLITSVPLRTNDSQIGAKPAELFTWGQVRASAAPDFGKEHPSCGIIGLRS